MPRRFPIAAALVGAASALALSSPTGAGPEASKPVTLSSVERREGMQLEEALRKRRSVRSYAARSLTKDETARLLWAAQGITDPSTRGRTAPSAGALYPIAVYVVAAEGVHRYLPESHALATMASGDRRPALSRAALGQSAVRHAPLDIVLAGIEEKTARKYGTRSERYLLLEAGHVAQNVLLEAVALGLGAVPIAAFDDDEVKRVVGLERGERPLYIISVGGLEGGAR
jgi:SagB-type dehydrogenase family enzyme